MKVLLLAICLFVVAKADDSTNDYTVRLIVKTGSGREEEQDLCTPFAPMRCRMMCPGNSVGITDYCGKCACIAMDKPMCRKRCPPGQLLYPPCHCVHYPMEGESLNVCKQSADPGMCRGYFPMYFFNSASGQCEKFIYGGCKGNSNRFSTIEKCKSSCM